MRENEDRSFYLSHSMSPNTFGRYAWATGCPGVWVVCGTAATPAEAERAVHKAYTDYLEKYKVSTTEVKGAAKPPPSVATLVSKYIALRDKKDEMTKAFKEQLAPYNAALAKLEAVLLERLNAAGVDSMASDAGTAYKAVHTSVTVEDWEAALNYIKTYDAWEMLEARLSKTGVLAVMEDLAAEAKAVIAQGGTVDPSALVIPGAKVSQLVSVNVRRPS